MQPNYQQYGPTDFVCDDAFLRHQLAPTEQSTHVWEQWLDQHPHKRVDWVQAEQLLEAVRLGLSDYARTFLSEEVEARLLARIQATNAQAESPIIPLWQSAWVVRIAAACLVIGLGYVGWLSLNRSEPATSYNQQIASLQTTGVEVVNTTANLKPMKLPDGSQVWLAPQSRLTYPAQFGRQSRTVFLLGEATFEVTKNPQKPFFVFANELVTRVLGTRFVVRAYEQDQNVMVSVQHGQVSVYQNKAGAAKSQPQQTLNGVLLLPNQQVVFSKQSEQFVKTLVAQPIIVQDKKASLSFEFDETPVVDVFERLKSAYGVDIVYNAQVLEGCQLTASLTAENLYQKLDVITQSIGATYQLVDGQIIIAANGCQVP